MRELGYVVEFVSERLPVLRAVRGVFPIWRHLVLNPIPFFDIIAKQDDLNLKNAFTFCLHSARFVTATVVTIDYIAEALHRPHEPWNILTDALLEISVFAWFAVCSCGIAVSSYAAVRLFFKGRSISFLKLLIALTYTASFLWTITALIMISIILCASAFSIHINAFDLFHGLRHNLPPEAIQQSVLLCIGFWGFWVWVNFSPVLSTMAAARIIGVGVIRLVIATALISLSFGVLIFVIGLIVVLVVYLLFFTQ